MAYLIIEGGLTTGAGFVFSLKELLKSAGYTVLSSGTGTSGTYNSSGDDITNDGSGVGGMARNRAWFRIRSPDGINEWIFQRDNTNVSWRVMHNFGGDPFTDGTPSEVVTPDSNNQVACIGGGAGASPAFGANTFTTDNTYSLRALVDNVAPYGWWASGLIQASSLPASAFVWDPLVGTNPQDVFNFVFYFSGGDNSSVGAFNISYGTSNGNVFSNRERLLSRLPSTTLGSALNEGMILPTDWSNARYFNANDSPVTGLPVNPITLNEYTLPVMYGRSVAVSSSHFKGISTMLRLRTMNRSTGSVLEFSPGNYGVVMRDFILPWSKDTFLL